MYPSIKTISERLSLPKDKAKVVRGLMDGSIAPDDFKSVQDWLAVCHHEPRNKEQQMQALNEVLEGFGVEAIEAEWLDYYHQTINATYVNMGDTYIPTIVLCHKRGRFLVLSFGDYVESNSLYIRGKKP